MTQQFVRLIGGPNNGAIEKVDHDQMQIVKTKPLPVATSVRNFSLAPVVCTVEQTIYSRRVLHCDGQRLFYFAPEGVSDLEALQSVLGP